MADTSPVVAVVPKVVTGQYFKSCHQGALEAASELGIDLAWEGPERPDARAQAALVKKLTAERHPAGIAVSVDDASVLSRELHEARAAGIAVLTWDSDGEPSSRSFFVNQATAEGIGDVLATECARALGGRGQVGVLTSTLTAPNQSAWMDHLKKRLSERYPDLTVVAVRPTFESEETARRETEGLLTEHPDLGIVLAICAPAVRAAADAVAHAGRAHVKVIGTASPVACRKDVLDGRLESVVLWNTIDLGYLVVHATAALAAGRLRVGDTTFRAGRLGVLVARGDEIRLGRPHMFNKANIETARY